MVKLNQAMKRKNFGRHYLVGVLLAGNMVVADDVKLANGQHASADLVRRASLSTPPPASATEAVAATTSGTNQAPVEATPRRLVVAVTPASPGNAGNDSDRYLPLATGASPSPAGDEAAPLLPPLPSGVTELKFSEFFRQPIGPRGLELTDKLRSLEGRRIRILGYMARQTKPVERCFLLASVPLTLNEIEYGHADDLPATTLHVFTSDESPAQTPYTPGLLLLTGKLSLGNRLEADGRTSTVRLFLDPPTPEQQQAAEQAVATAKKMKPDGHDDHAGHGHAH